MDYPELIAEVSERIGTPGFVNRADHYVELAERELSKHFKPIEYPDFAPLYSATTNWILREEPDIYINAVLKQYYIAKADVEKAVAVDAVMKELVRMRKRQDRVAELYSKPYRVAGPRP